MHILAIDQGTTSTRGLRLTGSAAPEVFATHTHRQIYPQTGWVEHQPQEILSHIRKIIAAAGPLDAIGLANQGESCLAWDSHSGEPVSPITVWQDRRTLQKIEMLKRNGAEMLTLGHAGLPLDAYFSASKLGWILEHIPAAQSLLARGRLHLGTSESYFIERLTGHYATDISTASRTSLLNLKSGQWDQDLCELFAVPIHALPEIRPSMGDFGHIKSNTQHIPLTASIVDQQASLYGHGCRQPGDAKITFGTGAFALMLSGEKRIEPDNGVLPTAAWQCNGQRPEYALEGAVYSASSAINWARSLGLFQDFEQINVFTAPAAIERGLVFVPALTGLACPYWDGSAAGMWLGMSLDTRAEDLIQAILEGVAFRAAEVVRAMDSITPITAPVSIDGGMSGNPYFCQFLANTLQKTVRAQSMPDLTALGTALMAGTAHTPQLTDTQQHQDYPPLADSQANIARFADALNRCRNWHEPQA